MINTNSLLAAAAKKFPALRKSPGDPQGFADMLPPAQPDTSVDTSLPAYTAPAATAPAKQRSNMGGLLAAGLQGAAYGAQANVGRAQPGSETAQGLLRGLVGTGMVSANIDRAAAAKEAAGASLSSKIDLLLAKQALKPIEPSWQEKFNMSEAGKDRRAQNANTASIDRAARLKQAEQNSSLSEEDKIALKQKAYSQAYKEFTDADLLDDPALAGKLNARTDDIYEYWLNPKQDFSKIKRD